MKKGYFVRHKKIEDGYYFEVFHNGHIYSGKVKSMKVLKALLSEGNNIVRFVSEHKNPEYLPMTEVYNKTGSFSASKYFTSRDYVFRK